MANKSAHKARTRARILDEAASAIRTHGTQGISVVELMKRAGLTHGGFYAHFESRDDLVAHAIDHMFAESAALLDRFPGGDAAEPGLTELIDHYLSEAAYRAVDKGCPLPALLGEVGRMPPAARQCFENGVRAFRDRIQQALARLDHPHPAAMASSILAEMVGAMTLARASANENAALAYLAASRERLKDRVTSTDRPH